MMIEQIEQRQSDSIWFLPWAAMAFAIGYTVHGLDHLRRGMSASPPFIMGAGMVQGLVVVTAIALVAMNHRRAPQAAIVVGFGSALGFTYAHLLPTFLPGYQDSYISPPHINVTWFSWLSALTEIGTGVIFGVVGIARLREVNNARDSVLRRRVRNMHQGGGFDPETRSDRSAADRTAAGPGSR
ncbi:hypothetical protein MSP7336_02271 [Mycobacterium shimoidei]|uniref:Uncharacterized protein n=2 Tax=Mycobacterium shimoidei TaxID=29313 RepID=A0A375YYP3_MYCSH|nr:hypothetical protein [Mycobacterium shimoidei]SRX94024.1 hypothetical protein MSP7336_02271 [Mycobacterium shimoidei]